MTAPAPNLCDHAEAFAIGALDDDELRAFEAHHAACPTCPARVREFRELAALLAHGAPGVAPPAGLRARVLRRAAGRRRAWSVPLALAAALAAVALAGVQTARLAERAAALAATADTLRLREARVHLLEAQREAILDGATEMHRLLATGADSTTRRAGGQVFWRKDRHTWLVHVFDMPRPAGRTYQLWFVDNGRAISGGLLDTDAEGHGIVIVTVPPEARAATHAAISIEPAGGSAQPTGPVVLLGSVSS